MTFPSVPSATSEAAADSVNPTAASNLREQIYTLIQKSPNGLTDEEIQDQLSLAGNTERPRRWELSKAGRIGKFGTRKTKTGRQAAVWDINWIPTGTLAIIEEKDKITIAKPVTVTVNLLSSTGRLLQTLTAVRRFGSDTIILTTFSEELCIREGDVVEIVGL